MKSLLFTLILLVVFVVHAGQKLAEPFLDISVSPQETGGNALLVIHQLYDPAEEKPVAFKQITDKRVLVSAHGIGERPNGQLQFRSAIYAVELNNAPEAVIRRSDFINLPESFMPERPGADAVLFRIHKMDTSKFHK